MKYAIFYSSLLIFIAVSCSEEPIVRFGFDIEIKTAPGFWILKYKSIEGVGSIILHMSIE